MVLIMQTFIRVFLLSCCIMQTAVASKEITLSMLSLDQATKKIIADNQGKVLGAKTESVDGKKMHVIKILTPDGRVQYLKVDADSGKIIK